MPKAEARAYRFQEFPWQSEEPDARRQRLCASQRPANPIAIQCALEGASFARQPAAPQDEVIVMAYNVERGFRWREQIDALRGDAAIPAPDVILVSEADRGCSRTGYHNILREYARALGMYYVFGVEFIELPRFLGDGKCIRAPCEHGNGILSRYPLGNVRLIRHTTNKSWYNPLLATLRIGQPRLGGRLALSADVRIGERYLHVYSVHFESRGESYRAAQAAEVAGDGLTKPFNVVIGGDTNASRYAAGLRRGASGHPVTQAFFQRGYVDAHAGQPPEQRVTCPPDGVLDLILGRGPIFTAAGVGRREKWAALSDHLPVWARVRVA